MKISINKRQKNCFITKIELGTFNVQALEWQSVNTVNTSYII